MSHPLVGAYARVARAEVLLQYLDRLATDFGESETRAIKAHKVRVDLPDEDPPGSFEETVTFEYPNTPVPDVFSILIGEILYHLRAALDHLVFELAEHDSGVEQDGTQFPIVDTEPEFAGRIPVQLKGIATAHRARFEGLQPYKGSHNAWILHLRNLSNRDKHRELRPVLFATDVQFDVTENLGTAPPYSKVVYTFTMRLCFAPTKPFAPGPPETWPWVVPMLHEIAVRVREVLDSFTPDFE